MGAGALGSVFGGFLAEKGHVVYLIGREPYIKVIRDSGLKISGIWGEHLVWNVKGFTSIKEIADMDYDLILLSTKSFDTEEAVKQLLPIIGPSTMILSLQNGIGNLETISGIVGIQRTIGARVIFGVELIEPGHFKVTVIADKVLIGSISKEVPEERLEQIASTLDEAGIPTAVTKEIEKFIWLKVLYNCCLNAPAALLDTCYGKLGEFAATRDILRAVMTEVLSVAHSSGIDLGFPNAKAYEEVLYSKLLPITYAHHPSTLQDLKNGKKTEIDALNGAIVRIGQEHGIPTPVNWTLTKLILGKERIAMESVTPCRGA